MFPRKKIDLINVIFSLLAFVFVIVFVESITTLIILEVFFFIMTYKEGKIHYMICYLLAILSFLLGYVTEYLVIMKIILIIEYIYYFLDDCCFIKTILRKKSEERRKIDISENEYYRFKEVSHNNYLVFITVHFLVLLLSIVVG